MEEISPVLPEDLFISEILLRLTAKAIGRSRCVSKQWFSLLSSPDFVESHIKFHFHDPPENIIFTGSSGDSVYTAALADGGASRELILPPNYRIELHKMDMVVEGSCHGLVLLREEKWIWQSSMLLINPISLEAARVPGPYRPGSFAWGLGYDCSTEDYTFVMLLRKKSDLGRDIYVDTYNVKAKTRKIIVSSYNQNCDPHCRNGVYVNGCIHWLFDKDGNIGAFSLAREELEKLDLPRGAENEKAGFGYGGLGLYVLGGCLALNAVAVRGFPFFDVWMMKEYGVRDSWMRFRVWLDDVLKSIVQIPMVVCFMGDDEILMVKDKQLVAYKLSNGVWRDVVNIAGFPYRCVTAFAGSLVSPNYK